MIDIGKLSAHLAHGLMRNRSVTGSHKHRKDCEYYYLPCAIAALCDELEETRADNFRLRTELEREREKQTIDCPVCKGTKNIRIPCGDRNVWIQPCTNCNGTGKVTK